MNKWKTYLLGKIYMYMFNALNDAKIAEDIISYIKNKNIDELESERAIMLINKYKSQGDSFLFGLAYCEYYFNGYADYLYTRLFLKVFFAGKKNIETRKVFQKKCQEYINSLGVKDYYQDYSKGRIRLLATMLDLITNRLQWVKRYAEKNFEDLEYDRSDIIEGALTIQKENIKKNTKAASEFYKGTPGTEKVKFLQEVAKNMRHPKVFIKACAKTLNAASFWDRMFAGILRIRFLKI